MSAYELEKSPNDIPLHFKQKKQEEIRILYIFCLNIGETHLMLFIIPKWI